MCQDWFQGFHHQWQYVQSQNYLQICWFQSPPIIFSGTWPRMFCCASTLCGTADTSLFGLKASLLKFRGGFARFYPLLALSIFPVVAHLCSSTLLGALLLFYFFSVLIFRYIYIFVYCRILCLFCMSFTLLRPTRVLYWVFMYLLCSFCLFVCLNKS